MSSTRPTLTSPHETPRETHRETQYTGTSERRTRPRLTDQIQIIRELWLLREQARVQAAERCFLAELERLLSGRSYATQDHSTPCPPPPPQEGHPNPSAGVVSPSAPIAPPLPPFPPTSPASSFSAVSSLADGLVFESHPPPRSEHGPVRERPSSVSQEMEQARASQRVTNLNAEFRARLEGMETGGDGSDTVLSRSQSFGQLSGQRNVSSMLESQFRHHLENLLHRRGAAGSARAHLRMTSFGGGDVVAADEAELAQVSSAAYQRGDSAALEAIVRALREEVTVLKNVVSASFDLQLDIQRSIRQEVAAAMNAPATLSWPREQHDTSTATTRAPPPAPPAPPASTPASAAETETETETEMETRVTRATRAAAAAAGVVGASGNIVKAGVCTICLENDVDSLLYGCGHMCTCAGCGRQLLAGGQACPICRAPVRDVVRAYVVSE